MNPTPNTFKCEVTFRLSSEGQKDAIKRGLPSRQEQKKTVEMGIEMINNPKITVSANGEASLNEPRYRKYYVSWGDTVSVLSTETYSFDTYPSDEDLAHLPLTLVNLENISQSQASQEIKEKEKKRTVAREEAAEMLEHYRQTGDHSGKFSFMEHYFREETKAVEKHWRAVREAREEEEAKAKREAENAKTKVLKDWAGANGSEHLKAMLSFGNEFDWGKLAKDEWVKAHTPEGFRPYQKGELKDFDDRKCPSIQELEELSYWRKVIESEEKPEITWADLCWNIPEDDDRDAFASLDLTLSTPWGEEVSLMRVFHT